MRRNHAASVSGPIDNPLIGSKVISEAGSAKSALVRTVAHSVAPAESSASPAADTRGTCVREVANQPDILNLWRIWKETDCRIDSLTQAVREGVQVAEASNFARWLIFSGILNLLEPFDQDVPLPIRGAELRRKTQELIYECAQWFSLHERSNKPRDGYISESKLAAIESDLRAIKDALSLRSAVSENALHVLPGG